MLYDIIFVCLVAYVCFTPYFYAQALKFGIKIGTKPEKAAEMPIFNVPEKKEKPKMTDEEYRKMQILANINRYDGTSNGQKEIKKRG